MKNYFLKYKTNYSAIAFSVIVISTVVRLIVASNVELGNDEVYYWLYALYPDISHFDHPPMVGFFIQFFTGNLYFDSEVFIRLAAIIPASFNMFILFKIATYLKDELAGLISVLLYNISIYGLVISGIFILPDSPLLTFWLLSFFFFLRTLPLTPKKASTKELIFAFLFLALAIYSKYQGVYLLLGVFLYILFYNRAWFLEIKIYLLALLPLLSVFLIFWWNYQNNFISFTFHNDRISLWSFNFNSDSFLREILGQIMYNNPFTFFLSFLMISAYFKGKWNIEKSTFRLFAVFVFPLIFTVIYLSFSRDTLPHWSGLSYITLLPLVGVYLAEKKKYITSLYYVCVVLFALLFFAIGVVNKGWLMPDDSRINKELGSEDFTLDMFGWKQTGEKVASFFDKNPLLKEMSIISNKWFPAAHIQYYVAKPMNKKVYGVGNLKDIHKYYWIDEMQKPLTKKVLYLTDSRNYKDPKKIYGKLYSQQKLLQSIPILREGKIVKYFFIFQLSNTDDSD